MFQIGAIGSMDHDGTEPKWYKDAFRSFMSSLDVSVYSLLTIVYQILFNIADSTFFSSTTIKHFYNRVQLILGVFMIFKLSISLLHAVINPDYLTDQKKGMGQIITRIIAMLAMFAAIIPLNVPLTQTEITDAKNGEVKSYNYHLNQSGLLFGTMYSLQERILKGNVLEKIVLEGDSNQYNINENGNEKLENNANKMSVSILKGFIRINLKEGASGSGKIDEDDYICSKEDIYGTGETGTGYNTEEVEILKKYKKAGTISDVVDNINKECNDKGANAIENRYMFTYTMGISTAVGIFVVIIFFGFCIDIAVRTIKLAVLRLLAPIPIISYIDPKSSENGSFASWTKSLISTYLDLFIRLGIVYFAIFLVQEICENGLDIPISNGAVGVISSIFIIVGIFYFARMAPKFITDALGLKGMMTNIGLSGMLAGAGALATGGGLGDAHDAARNARRAQTNAFNEGKKAPLMSSFTSGRDMMAQHQTGNPKMTYDQMKRGRAHLARQGIDNDYGEKLKTKMYDLKDDAKRLKSINDKVNLNGYDSLSNSEKDLLESEYRKNHGINQGPLSAQQYEEMKNSAMESYIQKDSDAGRVEAEYNMINKEQEAWGAAPGYHEKYHSTRTAARVSDFFSADGRAAMQSGSRQEYHRNIVGAPGNTIRGAKENRAEHRAENVRNRGAETAKVNDEVVKSRKNNN